jgi:DNA-binding protein Fis
MPLLQIIESKANFIRCKTTNLTSKFLFAINSDLNISLSQFSNSMTSITGQALFLEDSVSHILNSSFSNLSSNSAPALYALGSTNSLNLPLITLVGNVFESNSAKSNAGAILLKDVNSVV